jgi:hypothetical protein
MGLPLPFLSACSRARGPTLDFNSLRCTARRTRLALGQCRVAARLKTTTMARISHAMFDNKAGRAVRTGLALLGVATETPAKATDDASVKASAGPPLETSAEASARSPASSPAGSPDSSPENTPANGSESTSDDFPPLTVSRIGDTVRVVRPPDEMVEWTNQDFAQLFLRWLATEPACRNGWVSVLDIETEFFPRFQADAGCHHLGVGALYRGLGKVTKKRERTYTEYSGKRCSMTEYKVTAPAAVVQLAQRRASLS